MDMKGKYLIKFNAVVEIETPVYKVVELTADEYEALKEATHDVNSDAQHGICIDQITEEDSDVINDLLLYCTPDRLKKNCVSMVYTDVDINEIKE